MKAKDFSIKLILTVPAIVLGIISGIRFFMQPVIVLWTKKPEEELEI